MESKDWSGFGYLSPDFSPGMPASQRIWTPIDLDPPVQSASGYGPPFGPPAKLSENIILNVLVKMDDT